MGQILSAAGGGQYGGGGGRRGMNGGGSPYGSYPAGFGTDPNGPGGKWPGYYIGGGGPSGPPSGGDGGSGSAGSPFTSTLKSQDSSAWDGQLHAPVGDASGVYGEGANSTGGSGAGGGGSLSALLQGAGNGGGSVSKYDGSGPGDDSSHSPAPTTYGEANPDPLGGMTYQNPMRRRRGGYDNRS